MDAPETLSSSLLIEVPRNHRISLMDKPCPLQSVLRTKLLSKHYGILIFVHRSLFVGYDFKVLAPAFADIPLSVIGSLVKIRQPVEFEPARLPYPIEEAFGRQFSQVSRRQLLMRKG